MGEYRLRSYLAERFAARETRMRGALDRELRTKTLDASPCRTHGFEITSWQENLGLIVGQGMRLTLAGLLIGLVGAIALWAE